MIRIFIATFLLFYFFKTFAQSSSIDSIKELLIHHPKEDTVREGLLSSLAAEYSQLKPDTAGLIAMEEYRLSTHIGYLKGEARSLTILGIENTLMGNYSQALKSLLLSNKIAEKIKYTNVIISNLINIGNVYNQQEDHTKALEYYIKAKQQCEQQHSERSLCSVYINIAENYYSLKNYDSSKFYTQQANILAARIKLYRVLGHSYKLMGLLSFETGEEALSMGYYRLSIPYILKANNFVVLTSCYKDMAQSFEKLKITDSSIFYAHLAFDIAKERKFQREQLEASDFLASFYREHLNKDSLIKYQQISRVIGDTLFSQQKSNELRSLDFEEKMRQQEIQIDEIKSLDERNRNLQFSAILIGLITFIILFFLLSQTIIVKTKFIEFFGVLGLLAVFEFINLFIHPYLTHLTNDTPLLMLGILILIGAVLVPFHHKLEKWITQIMVEKNKKIRLEAAKKTIQQLEC